MRTNLFDEEYQFVPNNLTEIRWKAIIKKNIKNSEKTCLIDTPFRRVVYLFLVLVASIAGGSAFVEEWIPEPLHPSFGLTQTRSLSDYLPSLKGSRGDTELFFFEGRSPGGIVLILGGTHPNEPAATSKAATYVPKLSA